MVSTGQNKLERKMVQQTMDSGMLFAMLPLQLGRMQKKKWAENLLLFSASSRDSQRLPSLPSPGGCCCLQESSQHRQTADRHVGRKASDTLVQGSVLGSDRSHSIPYGMDLATLCLSFLVCRMGTIKIHTSLGGCEDGMK